MWIGLKRCVKNNNMGLFLFDAKYLDNGRCLLSNMYKITVSKCTCPISVYDSTSITAANRTRINGYVLFPEESEWEPLDTLIWFQACCGSWCSLQAIAVERNDQKPFY